MDAAAVPPSPRRRTGWVALFYLALTLVLTYPLSVRPASTVINAIPDTELFIWTLAWDVHAFTNQPLSIFDANIFHPYSRTLAYSENLIGSAIFAAPVIWLTANPVLALNIVSLLTVVLCGVGAYLLGRTLGMSFLGALMCGVIFAFAPSRFFRISQMHLTAVQWIPFTLAFLHAYWDRGRRRDLWLALACFSLQALTSGHGAVFLLVAIVCVFAYRVARREPLDIGSQLRDFGLMGALLLLPAILTIIPYGIVQRDMGLRRVLGDFGPSPESFLASPTHLQMFLTSLVPEAHIYERASALLFPGFLSAALAAFAFVKRAPAVMPYTLLTMVSLLLSIGRPLSIWPLVYWLPGMNFMRGPSRFMILATLGLAVLAGFGFDRLRSIVGVRRQTLVTVGAFALALAEFTAIPFDLDPFRLALPAADRWLNGQPKPFVVAEVPVEANERYQTAYMLHSMAHWQKTVHGYSGMRPPLHDDLYRQLTRFPDDRSLEMLTTLGVTYIVVHADQYRDGEWPVVEERLKLYAGRLTMVYADKGARVYALAHRSAKREGGLSR
jgi:hypothetical protein